MTTTKNQNALDTIFGGARKENNAKISQPDGRNPKPENKEEADMPKAAPAAAPDVHAEVMRPVAAATKESKTLLTVDVPIPVYRQMRIQVADERTLLRDIITNKIEFFCEVIEKVDDDEAKALIESLKPPKQQTQRTTLNVSDDLFAHIRKKAASCLVSLKAFMQAALVYTPK